MVTSGLHKGHYKTNMGIIRDEFLTDDYDWVHVVTGYEGLGKSTLAIQTCFEIDPTFNLSRVCLSAEEYIEAVRKATKGQAILFDEAAIGLFSREAMSKTNITINKILMTVRAKNLFHCLVLPNFFVLDRNIAQYRATSWVHIYLRGAFNFYSRKRLSIIAAEGKLGKQKPNFTGTFGPRNRLKRWYNEKKMKRLGKTTNSNGLYGSPKTPKNDKVMAEILKNPDKYSNVWRHERKIDLSLVMNDFNVDKSTALMYKKLAEREFKVENQQV